MYEIFERLCEEKGLTVAEISRLTGISKSTLSDWKTGKFQLSDKKRRIIAYYLDCSLDYLDGLTPFRHGQFDLDAEVARLEEYKASKEPVPEVIKEHIKMSQKLKEVLSDSPYKDFDLAKKIRDNEYYTNARSAEIANQIAKNPQLQVLFDSLRDVSEEELEAIKTLVGINKK